MTTKLLIDRELLERAVKADASNGASSVDLVDGWKAMEQIRAMLAAAPSAPKADPVKVQLLEALEELMYASTDKAEALATAAIAAARKGEG